MTTAPAYAYERDPFLRVFETEVVESGKEGTRAFVVLADTILYPEGGGQPSDRGWIAKIAVEDVQTVKGQVRHYVAAAPSAGRVRVELDWSRRFDHMQQHTGQHLLTAVAQERFGWHTTAFHLGAQASDIELDVAVIAPEQLAELEEAVAAEIRAGRPVRSRRVSPEEFAGLPVRTRGLPEGYTGDIRLVEMDGIDLNTCGGTHVRSTAEIEALALLGSEPLRGGTRLRFVAGGRLRRLLGGHERRNAELRKLLGGPDEELTSLVGGKLDQLKEASRRIRSLEEELAVEAARSLAAGERIGAAHWPQRDPAFLQRVAREFTALVPNGVALLTAGEGDTGHFVICAGEHAGVDLAKIGRAVADILAGRGGGAGRIFQGKASALSRRDEAFALLRRLE
mgnify:CR=1 FL=1